MKRRWREHGRGPMISITHCMNGYGATVVRNISVGQCDVPQSTDHYMEPAQHGVQDVLNISTEVHVFHRTRLDLDHARLEKDHSRLDLDHEVSQND